MKKLIIFFAGVSLFLVTGCRTTLSVHANIDGSVSAEYEAALGKAFADTMYAAAGMTDENNAETAALFDAQQIQEQFISAGYPNAEISVPSKTAIKVFTPAYMQSDDVLYQSGVISCKKNGADHGTLTLTFSPQILARVYAALPQNARSYADLFMAPVFTGEPMSEKDYTELVASLYGQDLADELASAHLNIALYAPENAKKEKPFSISLVTLLTLTEPVSYSLSW